MCSMSSFSVQPMHIPKIPLCQLVGAGNCNVFRSLSFEDQLVAFLRDDFMSSASTHISAVQRLSDSFIVDVVAFRQRSLASLSSPD